MSITTSRRRLLAGLGALAALSACGAPGPAAAPAVRTRTVEGDFGPVELPVDPQRVVAGYDTDTDTALVLGLGLVGAPGARGSATLPFPEYQPADRLAGVERVATFLPEPSYEAIAALNPDAILDGAFGDPERFERLNAIAPTLSYNTANYTDWRDGLRLAAEAFGREAQADEFLAAYDARADALRARVEERFPSRDVAVFYPDGSGGLVSDTRSSATLGAMLDVGFVATEGVVPPAADPLTFAAERLGDLAVLDVIVLTVDVAFEAGETSFERVTSSYDTVTASPLWAALPAVVAGRVYEVPAELSFPSPLTATASLDVVERTLLA